MFEYSIKDLINFSSSLSFDLLDKLVNILFIIMQIVILRKNYDWFQLLQVPALFIFGVMIDFSQYLIRDISYTNYLSCKFSSPHDFI